MEWKTIIAYILFILVGFNFGAVVMLGKELRLVRFFIMIILLVFVLIFARLEQKTFDRKINVLIQELSKKKNIITNAQEKLNKTIQSIKF